MESSFFNYFPESHPVQLCEISTILHGNILNVVYIHYGPDVRVRGDDVHVPLGGDVTGRAAETVLLLSMINPFGSFDPRP